MKSILLLLILSSMACAYHAPTEPAPVPTPAPVDKTPASLRLMAATRSDRDTDVIATVLTAGGGFVPGMHVVFSADAGTFSSVQVTTNEQGEARSIFSGPAGTTTVYAWSGGMTTSTRVLTSALPLPLPPQPAPPPPVYVPPPPPSVPPPIVPVPPPAPPTVQILADATALVGAVLKFGVSVTAASGLAGLTWDFGDGGTAVGPSPTHVYLSPGRVVASVIATDMLGRLATSQTSILISAVPIAPLPAAPELAATLSCVSAAHGTPTTCNVAVTYGGTPLPSATITNVAWDWGDGFTNTTALPLSARSYVVAGTYTIFAAVTATTTDGARTVTVTKIVGVQ